MDFTVNPIAYVIETTRKLLIVGEIPDMKPFILFTICTYVFSEISYRILKGKQNKFGDMYEYKKELH